MATSPPSASPQVPAIQGQAGQAPAPGNSRSDRWAQFLHELDEHGHEIAPLLPSTLSWERFKNTAIAAVRNNPRILDCEPRSLVGAIGKAAADGLLPDGREGVITNYSVKVKKKKPGSNATYEEYEQRAQWNPMTHGLRKRARELGDILVDAQVVYENDKFLWRQGDQPALDHEPAALSTERGAKIGTYAIFRDQHGTILHREVMNKAQVMAVRNQSKAPDSLMWTTFEEEGWRKSVIRRGFKALPTVNEKLDALVRRDDENFTFIDDRNKQGVGNGQVSADVRPALAGPPKAPPRNGGSNVQPGTNGGAQPVEEAVVEVGSDAEGSGAPVQGQAESGNRGAGKARPVPPGVGPDGKVHDYGLFAAWARSQLEIARDAADLIDLWEQHIEPWRERIAPEWFKQLRLIQAEIIASWSDQ